MRLFTCTLLTLTLVNQLLVQCTDSTVINDIFDRLSALTPHVQINSTLSVSELEEPLPKMQRNAQCCVPEFKRLLLATLSSVIVSEEYQNVIVEIRNLLDLLHGPAQPTPACKEPQCKSKNMSKTLKFEPFQQYKMYLKRLNMRRKRTI